MTRNVDLISIRLYLAVVEEGSIAKAATREFIVPSAISKRVGELESLFGVPLLERSVRGVRPTPAGVALVHHSRMILQATERMHSEMSEYLEGVRGRVKVLGTLTALTANLTADIASFVHARKGVKIELEEQNTPTIFRAVLEGEADIGIAPDIADHEGLTLFPYHRFALSVVVPKNHTLAKETTLRYAQALEFDQVEVARTGGLSQLLDAAARQLGIPKRTCIRVNSYESVCRMVSTGMGAGVVPLIFMNTLGLAESLKFIPLIDDWACPMTCLVVRDEQALPEAGRALLTHLKQQAEANAFEPKIPASAPSKH